MNPFHCRRHEPAGSRREFLSKWGMGFGSLPLIHLLERESFFRTASAKGTRESILHPLAPKPPHQSASGRNVVFIYLQGGASHVDTLDPKPVLTRFDGRNLPQSFASDDQFRQYRRRRSQADGFGHPFSQVRGVGAGDFGSHAEGGHPRRRLGSGPLLLP